jgi:hypothetical protein
MKLVLECFGNKNIDFRLKIVGGVWLLVLSLSMLMFFYLSYDETYPNIKNLSGTIGILSLLFLLPYLFLLHSYGNPMIFKKDNFKSFIIKDDFWISGISKQTNYDDTVFELKGILRKLQTKFEIQDETGPLPGAFIYYSKKCLIESNELAFEVGEGLSGRTYVTIHFATKEIYESTKPFFKFERVGFRGRLIRALKP